MNSKLSIFKYFGVIFKIKIFCFNKGYFFFMISKKYDVVIF